MNPIASLLPKGLAAWGKVSADVSFLIQGGFRVPRILLGSADQYVLIASGLHLEETSGPALLLDPEGVFPVLKPILDKKIGILMYPVINQVGLKYLPTENDHLLRYNDNNFNYNDGWGIPGNKKATEVALVEKDILSLNRISQIKLALSLHEDSETPGKGYIYTNGISDSILRKSITQKIKGHVDVKQLANKSDILESGQETFQGGIIEDDICIVDSKDKGSIENWLADDLKIPTVLSEGPFGLDLEVRKKFQLEVLKATLLILT